MTFIKELPSLSTFTIFFIDNCEQNDDYYEKFAKNNIVSVKKSTLSSFHFTSFPIWQQLLFQMIILSCLTDKIATPAGKTYMSTAEASVKQIWAKTALEIKAAII